MDYVANLFSYIIILRSIEYAKTSMSSRVHNEPLLGMTRVRLFTLTLKSRGLTNQPFRKRVARDESSSSSFETISFVKKEGVPERAYLEPAKNHWNHFIDFHHANMLSKTYSWPLSETHNTIFHILDSSNLGLLVLGRVPKPPFWAT